MYLVPWLLVWRSQGVALPLVPREWPRPRISATLVHTHCSV